MANNQIYTPSATVISYQKKAKEYEDAVEKAIKRLSTSSLGVAVEDALSRIQNRLPFSYDVNADGLYQQYKQQYETLGRQAMKETVARAAEKTGGYANSYGVTAGAQAYGSYLEKLGDKIPSLYSLAYERYQNQGKELQQQYDLLLSAQNRELAQNQRELDALRSLADYYASQGLSLKKEERTLWENALARADALAKQDYEKSRDAIKDAQWQKEYALDVQKANRSSSSASAKSPKASGETLASSMNWDGAQWESYFAGLRKEDGREQAIQYMQAMIRSGVLPKNMISYAVMGAKGALKGH